MLAEQPCYFIHLPKVLYPSMTSDYVWVPIGIVDRSAPISRSEAPICPRFVALVQVPTLTYRYL
jgi:hypothetical protein